MERIKLENKLLERFPYDPTNDQRTVIIHLSAFDGSKTENPLYILKGYAGTGKTSLISSYVKELKGESLY